MRAAEFITEEGEPIRIKISGASEKSKAFVDRVYAMFPESPLSRNNRIMAWNDAEILDLSDINNLNNATQLVQFELTPRARDTVDVKWIAATPLRSGAGTKAMTLLKDMAQQYGVKLELSVWNKGATTPAQLTKFYKKQGFKQVAKGARDMSWTPDN
jgi:hypothetical protein